MLSHRRASLTAVLGFVRLRWREPAPPVAVALARWIDSWTGFGAVTVGMAHQGYDLQLTGYDECGWRATFYTSGMEHSATRLHDPELSVPVHAYSVDVSEQAA